MPPSQQILCETYSLCGKFARKYIIFRSSFSYALLKIYVLEVTWSEGTSTTIYRRYSDFFEFQVSPLVESHATPTFFACLCLYVVCVCVCVCCVCLVWTIGEIPRGGRHKRSLCKNYTFLTRCVCVCTNK